MNKDDDLFSFMVNPVKTLWYWHSTTLMGLKQSASTDKPSAKYPYRRRLTFETRLSHPERSNKNPALLQNNPFVDFLSAKQSLCTQNSDELEQVLSSWSFAVSSKSRSCVSSGFGGNVLGGCWWRRWPWETQSLQQPEGGQYGKMYGCHPLPSLIWVSQDGSWQSWFSTYLKYIEVSHRFSRLFPVTLNLQLINKVIWNNSMEFVIIKTVTWLMMWQWQGHTILTKRLIKLYAHKHACKYGVKHIQTGL